MSVTLKGIGASPGITWGKAFLLDSEPYHILKVKLAADMVEDEIARFHAALERTRREISELQAHLKTEIDDHSARIFDMHGLILEDEQFVGEAEKMIRSKRMNAEYVVSHVLRRVERSLRESKDPFVHDRAGDVRDVRRRVLTALLGYDREHLAELEEEVIVVAKDLAPSDTVRMHKEKVIGFVTDWGSQTSHTAIMARSLEIPAVVGLGRVTSYVNPGDTLIIDGVRGQIIVNPTKKELKEYKIERRRLEDHMKDLVKLRGLPAETVDGRRIFLTANVEVAEEIEHVKDNGADGVGLFRTEFLYMNRDTLPDEEEQFLVYQEVVQSLAPSVTVMRTVDLGGDKFASVDMMPTDINPVMGYRGIRLCLAQPNMFKAQLRAMLRASAFGPVRIMYPLITGIQELHQANHILHEVQEELTREGLKFDKNLKIGVMIEVPSAVMTADILAQEADFFSIGTNDLIQYTLAVDRRNQEIAYLYQPCHPGVLRMIQQVIHAAARVNLPVSVCGEIAGDPGLAMLLVGMGIEELSMAPIVIPEIKNLVRKMSFDRARALASRVLGLTSAEEIHKEISEELERLE